MYQTGRKMFLEVSRIRVTHSRVKNRTVVWGKMAVYVLAVAMVIAGTPLTASAAIAPASFTVRFDFPAPSCEQKADNTYRIRMDGVPTAREIGKPALPCYKAAVLVPPGKKARSVTAKSVTWRRLPGVYKVEWGQPMLPADSDRMTRVQPDKSVYERDAIYPRSPAKLEGTGLMRGLSIANVQASPMRYNPMRGTLEYCTSMELVVVSDNDGAASKALADRKPVCVDQPIFMNAEEAATWYEETPGKVFSGTGNTADYVIITTDALASAVDSLKNYKEAQGLSVNLTTTSWIYANCSRVDNP